MRYKAAFIALIPAIIAGYTFTGASWSWQDHPIEDPFTLDVESFPADAGDDADIEAAIVAAMDDWNGLDLDLALRYDGVAAGGNQDNDGFFHIFYDGVTVGSEGVLAYTGTWVWQDGAAYDCDLVFMHRNAYGDVLWSSDPDGAPEGRYDVQAVALHELGHCLGVGHSEYSDAVMTAYYAGYRELTPDDTFAVEALFDQRCPDGDGDGVASCDGDCDDANAAIYPGAAEVCDGEDDDCDGVIDNADTLRVDLGVLPTAYDGAWYAGGNAFTVDSPTALVRASQRLSTDEGARLVWSIYSAEDPGGPWTLVRTEIAWATADSWQDSPTLDLPLEPGRHYTVALGAHNAAIRMWYEQTPALEPSGPITPLGSVSGRDLGDQNSAPDARYLWQQRLTLIDEPDPDGDGQTALCGDCATNNAEIYAGAPELCGGHDNDCDQVVDEGLDFDADGDGLTLCDDLCPEDPDNDADADGLCADADPCPTDGDNDIDGDGLCRDEDPCWLDPDDLCDDPTDTGAIADKGQCGCGARSGPPGWLALLALLALRRR